MMGEVAKENGGLESWIKWYSVTTAKFNEFKGKPRQAQVAGFSQP
jgi:hypothetical protein